MAPIFEASGTAKAVLFSGALELFLPFPFVALRLWSRNLTRQRLALNDYLILFALFFTTAFNVNGIIASILGGYGQHIENVTPSELYTLSKLLVVSTVLWPSANALIKLSVLHFYKSVFSVNKRTIQAAYVLAVLTICYWLVGIIMAFAICVPFEYNWNKNIPGHCGSVFATYLAIAIINLVIDIMVVALPLPSVWSLNMRRSRKIALTFIFSLGAVICVISIVRCWSIATLDNSDLTFSLIADQTLTVLELDLGIVNACLLILQPIAVIIARSFPGFFVQKLLSKCSQSSDESLHEFPINPGPVPPSKRRIGLNEMTSSLARDDTTQDRDESNERAPTTGLVSTSKAH